MREFSDGEGVDVVVAESLVVTASVVTALLLAFVASLATQFDYGDFGIITHSLTHTDRLIARL